VIGAMKRRAPAQQAWLLSRRNGDVLIKVEKQLMESGVGQGCVLLSSRSLTAMAKPGRNDPCPAAVATSTKSVALPRRKRSNASSLPRLTPSALNAPPPIPRTFVR
jgi:hypothetical protein